MNVGIIDWMFCVLELGYNIDFGMVSLVSAVKVVPKGFAAKGRINILRKNRWENKASLPCFPDDSCVRCSHHLVM